jgi:hypothetical protein
MTFLSIITVVVMKMKKLVKVFYVHIVSEYVM